MPIRIADLLAKTRTISVAVEDEQVSVTYRPLWYNAEVEARLEAEAAGKLPSEDLTTMFCECLAGWDVVGPDGKPLPITPAAIREHRVPIKFLRLVLDAVAEDMRPGKPRDATSAGS
jgi:hypothetical protein